MTCSFFPLSCVTSCFWLLFGLRPRTFSRSFPSVVALPLFHPLDDTGPSPYQRFFCLPSTVLSPPCLKTSYVCFLSSFSSLTGLAFFLLRFPTSPFAFFFPSSVSSLLTRLSCFLSLTMRRFFLFLHLFFLHPAPLILSFCSFFAIDFFLQFFNSDRRNGGWPPVGCTSPFFVF